jgi:hypothetical protein
MRSSESAARGQKIVTETSPDRSSHKVNAKEAFEGRSMPDKGVPMDPNLYNGASKSGNIPK